MRNSSVRRYLRRLPALVAILFLFEAAGAAAFTSWEHCWLGNEGFRLIVAYVEADPELGPALEEAMPLLREFNARLCEDYNEEKPRVRSYGEAVKVVDYVQRPHRLFQNRSDEPMPHPDFIPSSWDQMSPAIPKQQGLESLRASAGNDHHFQGELFTQMRSGHRDALDAAHDGHLFYALVLNAISDHFLHDYFAPGHLATQRDNSHDAVALGLHDRINQNKKECVRLKAEESGWERLQPLLDFVEGRCRQETPDCPNWIKKEKLRREAQRRRWSPTQAESLAVIAGLTRMVRRTSEARASGLIGEEPCETEGLAIRGDGQLAQFPKQQLFMLLVQMRSILDVLETYARRDGGGLVNTFGTHKWTGFADAERGKEKETIEQAAAEACIAYACYDIQDRDRWWASDILMFGVGGQAPTSNTGSSRWEGAVELVPLSGLVRFPKLRQRLVMRSDCGFRSLCNSAVVLGASYKGDDEFSAIGPRLRLLKALPKIDLQLSAQVEYLRYRPDGGVETWDWTYGVRADLGFSLMSLYVGVNEGSFARAGLLERDVELSFGVGVGLPIQRIKKTFRRLKSPWNGTVEPEPAPPAS